jgi:hypothetical protein
LPKNSDRVSTENNFHIGSKMDRYLAANYLQRFVDLEDRKAEVFSLERQLSTLGEKLQNSLDDTSDHIFNHRGRTYSLRKIHGHISVVETFR